MRRAPYAVWTKHALSTLSPPLLLFSLQNSETWVYPSEQQYFNAIRRKGHDVAAADMPSTLAIHNAVNEKGWEMVRRWERLHAGGSAPAPKLLRFTGRPTDTSPKAWIKTNLLGYRAPFDRQGHLRCRQS